MQQVNLTKLETQKLEVQKVAQSGQSQVGEDRQGAIAGSAELTESSNGETLFLLEDSQSEESQPVEIKSTEPVASLSSQVSSETSLTMQLQRNPLRDIYDQRCSENSY